MTEVWTPTTEDLGRYRAVQQLAYRCAETVGASLEPGTTEKAAARRMKQWLLDHGVDDWFHVPFAWFGDRTAFRGFRTPLQFFPTDRQLVEGMPFILDCAPVVDGATADIGYASSLGPNPVLDRILDDLAAHRALILDLARQRRPLREIYQAVDELAATQGYENRHQRYPFGVIAHQVGPLPKRPANVVVAGFGLRSLRALLRSAAVGRARGWSPLWNRSRRSAHPPTPGLWAVEPHLGTGDVAAKFEELLVVTDDDVFWLDDDLPHVRRWQARSEVRS
jgi:Xaa-Pro aminopeptidase